MGSTLSDFINNIVSYAGHPVIEVLRARGFLIHENNGSFFLSDNATSDDSLYLNEILQSNKLGSFCLGEGQNSLGRVNISDSARWEDAARIFQGDTKVGSPCCFVNRTWSWFLNRQFGIKCDVRLLEPFVARYIKAISACGVLTDFSCDGNHKDGGIIKIGCCKYFSIWHNWLYNNIVPQMYRSAKYDNGNIPFSEKTQMDEYYKLNMAAAYLYERRFILRALKNDAAYRYRQLYLNPTVKNEAAYSEILSTIFKEEYHECI